MEAALAQKERAEAAQIAKENKGKQQNLFTQSPQASPKRSPKESIAEDHKESIDPEEELKSEVVQPIARSPDVV